MSQSLTGQSVFAWTNLQGVSNTEETNAFRSAITLSLTHASLVHPRKPDISQGVGSNHFGWILHPAIDLLLVCGGLSWALFAVHFFVAKPTMSYPMLQILAFVVLIGSHVLSETHTVATLVSKAQTKMQDELPDVWGSAKFHSRQLLGWRDQAGGGIERYFRHGRAHIGKAKPPQNGPPLLWDWRVAGLDDAEQRRRNLQHRSQSRLLKLATTSLALKPAPTGLH